jgi:hypothetical protein
MWAHMIKYLIVNGLFAALCYYSVTSGNAALAVIFISIAWFMFIGSTLAVVLGAKRPKLIFPYWVDALYDFGMALFLVLNGWGWTGAILCLCPVLVGLLEEKDN